MARLFTIDYGDGTPPQTGKPALVEQLHIFPRKATYQVKVTDQTTGKSTTHPVVFPPDFILAWTTTATGILGTWQNVIEVTTPPAIESIVSARFDDRIIQLGSITKTGPGRFRVNTQSLIGGENATLRLEFAGGYAVTCAMKVRAAGTGVCESYAPLLQVKHVSNAGVLGIGRGTWLHVYTESGVPEVNLRWLNSNGTPYDGTVIKVPTWRESANLGYWYGYKAELTLPGSTAKLICSIGPDGTCTL